MPSLITMPLLLVFPALMAFAACSDLITMKISNRLVLATAASFFVVALVAGLSPAAIGMHVAAGAVVLAASFGLFALGWIGGGDAKLIAAIALWFGFGGLFPFLLTSALFGGTLTMAMLMARRYPLPVQLKTVPWIGRLHDRKTGIPYGIALAAGALWVYPHGVIFAGLAG